MSVIDVEKLLQPVSEESPCGPNLEYDPAFVELNRLSQGKSEQMMGETVIPAEEPDWRDVERRALELCGRTKDVRLAVLLTRALIKTHAWQGFQDGLAYVHGLIDRHWEGVHPRLDPEDDNDPTWRVNILASLCGGDTMLKAVRETPLADSRQLGRFSLRDILIAKGKLAAPAAGDKPAPSQGDIEAAFTAEGVEELQARDGALLASLERVRAIEAVLTDKVGESRAASFAELRDALKAARQPLVEVLVRRGVAAEVGEMAAGAEGAGAARPISGEITSREDAIRMLDKICDYFHRYEPSSPVPILLQRAKRLVPKSFVDIVRDLAPGGLAEVESIRGAQE